MAESLKLTGQLTGENPQTVAAKALYSSDKKKADSNSDIPTNQNLSFVVNTPRTFNWKSGVPLAIGAVLAALVGVFAVTCKSAPEFLEILNNLTGNLLDSDKNKMILAGGVGAIALLFGFGGGFFYYKSKSPIKQEMVSDSTKVTISYMHDGKKTEIGIVKEKVTVDKSGKLAFAANALTQQIPKAATDLQFNLTTKDNKTISCSVESISTSSDAPLHQYPLATGSYKFLGFKKTDSDALNGFSLTVKDDGAFNVEITDKSKISTLTDKKNFILEKDGNHFKITIDNDLTVASNGFAIASVEQINLTKIDKRGNELSSNNVGNSFADKATAIAALGGQTLMSVASNVPNNTNLADALTANHHFALMDATIFDEGSVTLPKNVTEGNLTSAKIYIKTGAEIMPKQATGNLPAGTYYIFCHESGKFNVAGKITIE
jgi:hypothetical protein